MEISTGTFGTKGLPKFGPSAIDSSRSGAVTEVEGAFNNLMTTVKKFTAPGNDIALYNFGVALQQTWYLAELAASGKANING